MMRGKLRKELNATVLWHLGEQDGDGNLSLQVSKFGRATGNVRINIGAKHIQILKEVRDILLRSEWFVEAVGTGLRASEKKAEGAFQTNGKALLPAISKQTAGSDIQHTLRVVFNKLGADGRKAMQEWMKMSGLGESTGKTLLESVFGEEGRGTVGGSKLKKKAKKS